MFSQNNLDNLFFNVSQYSGCKCSDIFDIEISSHNIVFHPGLEFPGKKSGNAILNLISEYLNMETEEFQSLFNPEIGKDYIKMEYVH